ncbi:MAG: aldo/keto reductase [Spirochaetes bacterium]|nr:aldo/keto reductase [Spirochaetota bacterium]
MLYRIMPKINKKLSILGMGCMRLPLTDKKSPKSIDEKKAAGIVHYAIDNGINYFDTAYPYHEREGEKFIGNALKGNLRKKVYIATKLPTWSVNEFSDMEKFLDEQLINLKTENIDFYLFHALNRKRWEVLKRVNFEKFIDTAIKKGKIGHIGFSFHDDREIFMEIIKSYEWEFCQIQFNYLNEEFQAGIEGLKYAHQNGLGVIIMEPLLGGKLADNLPENIIKLFNKLSKKLSPAQWGLKWIWDKPEVSVVLSGMSNIEQLKENITAADSIGADSLSKEDMEIFELIKNEFNKNKQIPCTSCGYCQPCPSGVNIPTCFNRYNGANIFGNFDEAKIGYLRFVVESEQAKNCTSCRICEEKCPQSIEISKEMDLLKKFFHQ